MVPLIRGKEFSPENSGGFRVCLSTTPRDCHVTPFFGLVINRTRRHAPLLYKKQPTALAVGNYRYLIFVLRAEALSCDYSLGTQHAASLPTVYRYLILTRTPFAGRTFSPC